MRTYICRASNRSAYRKLLKYLNVFKQNYLPGFWGISYYAEYGRTVSTNGLCNTADFVDVSELTSHSIFLEIKIDRIDKHLRQLLRNRIKREKRFSNRL